MSEKKKEILICLLTGLVSVFIFCLIINIWNMDLNVPFVYAGDLSGLLNVIKTILRDESWWHFDGLGAPFHTNMWRQMMDAYIPNAIIFSIALITESVGYAINLYYIFSCGLSSMCAYYMLRKSNIRQSWSVIGALLYSLIPGHFFRNEGHIYVGSCFSIPLVIVTAMNLCNGNMCKLEYFQKKKLTFRELITSCSSKQIIGVLFFIIVTLCTLYYGVFSLMLLTFCAIYCCVNKKQLRHLYYYLQYIFAFFFCVILIYLPQILANQFAPCIEEINIISRYRGDVEFYSGKLIQYILPISGHRLPFFANMRQLYDSSFPLINENGTSSIGMIMSIGFVFGILCVFFNKEKYMEKYETTGKLELFMFMVSTVGGLGSLVGLINYNIRCYNRFSFLIGAVGIIISMTLFQDLCQWFMKKQQKQLVKFFISCFCRAFILLIGIFDQTTAGMAYTKEYASNINQTFSNDLKFVNEIETYEGENAQILVFPAMNAQQAAVAQTKEGNVTNYEDQMLFIHSNTSCWSIGSKAGESGERWINWLQTFDEKTQVNIAAAVGFSGIAIYYGGYSAERLDAILTQLNELLGDPIAINDNGTWAYYSIKNVRDQLLSNYTETDREVLKNKYLYNYSSYYLYNYSNLATTSRYQDDCIVLAKDTCQYGPYNSFKAGLYAVEIYGQNLKEAQIDCFNGINFEIDIEQHEDTYIKYYVRFETDCDNVEFRTFNSSENEIVIERIEINKM